MYNVPQAFLFGGLAKVRAAAIARPYIPSVAGSDDYPARKRNPLASAESVPRTVRCRILGAAPDLVNEKLQATPGI
jgi:hypothetical protein